MCLPIVIRDPSCQLERGEHCGFQWIVVHNGSGYRCGYIRLPQGHPWHGKGYDDIHAVVHGGLTYAAADEPCGDPTELDAPSWWVGFDCAHCSDAPDPSLPIPPQLLTIYQRFASSTWETSDAPHGRKIRTTEYVAEQCQRLCEQAQALALLRH